MPRSPSEHRLRTPRAIHLPVVCSLLLALAGPFTAQADSNAAHAGHAVELAGIYEVQVAEDFVAERFEQHASLLTAEGRIPLANFSGAPGLVPGSFVRVEGRIVDGTLLVERIRGEGPSSVTESGGGGSSDTLGQQRVLVTPVNFTNDPSEPHTISQLDWEILDETNPDSAASYYQEASYGRAWLTGSVIPWMSMPWDDSACNVWTDSGTQQVLDALDPVVDWTLVDRWIIVTPQNSSCGFNGISTSGKISYVTLDGTVQMSRAILNGAGLSPNYVAAHELAHGFAAVQHSADYECGPFVVDNDCNPTGLGTMTDRYDLMGHVWFGGHFTPPNKEQLGWFAGEMLDVGPPGGTYSLEPYETVGGGTKVLRIPVSWYVDDLYGTSFYHVSFRKNVGFDDIFTELSTDAAMIHMDARRFVGDIYGRSRLLDAKPFLDTNATSQTADSSDVVVDIGSSFTDSVHGVTISVLGTTGGDLDVSVSISQYCGNAVADAGVEEQCDGADLSGETCASIGFMDGILACGSGCAFDTSLCGMPRCEPGHAYGPADACTASFLADAEDIGLWRNRPTWTACRESSIATNFFDDSYLFFLNRRRTDDFSWIYRDSLPFDTTALPDGRAILSAELSLKVLASPGLINTHPNSADQLVLVKPQLALDPVASLGDFDQFGTLNSPVEGAPRIDVSDSVAEGSVSAFQLNASGLSWIDPAGWTTLGIRGGFDVDDVTHQGQQTELSMSFRTSDSPIFGPMLDVTYESVALPSTGPAGGLPAAALSVTKISPTELSLSWGSSCLGTDFDFAVYSGVLGGGFSDPQPLLCSTGGSGGTTIDHVSGSAYFLVVPRSADREGSYGKASDGTQRLQGASPCLQQQISACGT